MGHLRCCIERSPTIKDGLSSDIQVSLHCRNNCLYFSPFLMFKANVAKHILARLDEAEDPFGYPGSMNTFSVMVQVH